MALRKLPVPGRPTNLDYTRGKGLQRLQKVRLGVVWTFFHFSLIYHFSFLSPSLWGDGPIYTEILFERAVKPQSTNQPTKKMTRNLSRLRVPPEHACPNIQPFYCSWAHSPISPQRQIFLYIYYAEMSNLRVRLLNHLLAV